MGEKSGEKERENISCSSHRKWEERLKMVIPNSLVL
jgi:hypothetical protein